MDSKILQIMPAPKGLYAHYSGIDRDADFYEKAVCLALVEVEDGYGSYREVRAMGCGGKDDYIEFPDEADNFIGLCYISCKRGIMNKLRNLRKAIRDLFVSPAPRKAIRDRKRA